MTATNAMPAAAAAKGASAAPATTTAIANGKVLTPFRQIDGGGVLIEGGKIVRVFEGSPPPADRVIDAEGCYVSPGFIDMHVHGGNGFDYLDGTVEAYEAAGKFHMEHGAAVQAPTISASTDEELYAALRAFGEAKKSIAGGPDFVGVHLEGPYFSYEERGAQDAERLKAPDPEHYMRILDFCGDIVRWSSAPELPGALELADELARRGISCAIGHSNATYQQILPAIERGYTHVTHLYSGCSLLRRINAFRYMGVVESAFALDELTVEIIADGKHLPPELLRLIVKLKPWDKISLITDAFHPAGKPEGSQVSKRGYEVIVEDGVAKVPDRTVFAGSIATADRLVRNMRELAGVPLIDAVRMITLNPAGVLKISDRKGSLAPGKDADICVFDEGVNIKKVFVNGKMTVCSA
jgi:N-acetylglucosamine-6-phosphate deacetylase